MPSSKNLPKPFIKWAGGKTKLLPILLQYIPEHFNIYYEPFLGGGALFFALYRKSLIKKAILSDINKELIDSYKAIKCCVEEVISILDKFPHDKDFYYKLREQDPDSLPLPHKCARFIYLNKTGYNGLYRVNKKGKFNVPFGNYKNPNYKDFENLKAVSKALQIADLEVKSFEYIAKGVNKRDFVYFDPPYIPASKTASFTQYTANGFSIEEHKKLAEIFKTLSSKGTFAMLSNSDTEITRELYKDFKIIEIENSRPINSRAQKRKGWKELLILNYEP